MKFMGDFPMKGQTEQDLVATILKVNHEQRFLTENKQDFYVLLYCTDFILCS